jgi:drug/metabolite transporter (DMT)-like permease
MVQTTISAVSYLVNKRALLEIPVQALATLRFATASVLFLLLLWRMTPHRWPPREDWRRIAVLAVLGVPINQLFFLGGLKRTSAAHGALMYTLTPLFVLLIALALRTERLALAKVVGLAIALSGAALVIFERSASGLSTGNAAGDLEILIAVMAWAGYTALGKPLVGRHGPIAATAWPMALGTLLFMPIGIPSLLQLDFGAVTRGAWLSLVFLIVFTSVIAYLSWFFALGALESSRVAVFTNLQPVMTAVTSWLVFGESVTWRLAAGGALVIAGVLVTTRPTFRVAPAADVVT